LETSETVIGQPITYPPGQAKVTAAMVAMEPGQETGWHRHEVPLFVFMLEGELTVDYGPDGTRSYRAGDAFVEALGSPHDGRNTGSSPVKLLAVWMGAEGAANTVPLSN
jgi:quercetin dioxygenase-like cupin family protein